MKFFVAIENKEKLIKEVSESFGLDNEICKNKDKADILIYKEHNYIICKYTNTEIFKEKIESDLIFKPSILAIKRVLYRCLKYITNKDLKWGILNGIRPGKIVLKLLSLNKNFDEIERYFLETLLVNQNKIDILIEVIKKEIEINKKLKNFSVYIHIPVCPTKCSYCSFYSIPLDKNDFDFDKYGQKICDEIDLTFQSFAKLKVDSIYFGGGTPSCLPAEQIDNIFLKLRDKLIIDNNTEISFEAGRPDQINENLLECLKKNGVNRISLNTQTINNETLVKIGRKHNFKDFIDAFKMIKRYNFDSVNTDLIYGLPGENIDDFNKSIKTIVDLNFENITLHALSLKTGSELKNTNKSNLYQYNWDMVDVYSMLKENGYFPYYLYRQKRSVGNLENIGFSKKGKECIYNSVMIEEMQSVFAFGAGGVSKYIDISKNDFIRVEQPKAIEKYYLKMTEITEEKRKLLEKL